MDIVNQPYTDQIWIKSGCREFELDVGLFLKSAIGNKDISFNLVDSVPDHQASHPRMITDNMLVTNQSYIPLWPEFWGSFSYNPTYINRVPSKLFNCFINRTCPIRQSWFYQLVRRNLLDEGFVSFLLYSRKEIVPNPPDIDFNNTHEIYNWMFSQGCEIFAKEHQQMASKVPYQNFSGDLDQIVVDSKLSIVLETYFASPLVISFSEKIFRALQLPRPFVLYAAPGAIKWLKSQGFDVYDDIIDHSYDNESDAIQRQIKILDVVENCKNLVYNQSMLEMLEERASKNRALLIKFKNKWPEKLAKITEIIDQYK